MPVLHRVGFFYPPLAQMLRCLLDDPLAVLPPPRGPSADVPHAPRRLLERVLSVPEQELALTNALRYFPASWHPVLAPEFAAEMRVYGHIYMVCGCVCVGVCAWSRPALTWPKKVPLPPDRVRHEGAPDSRVSCQAAPVRLHPGASLATHHSLVPLKNTPRQLMIMNNLDPAVAQFPEELVTYGGNGSVFQNWIQFRLTMWYLSHMTEQQVRMRRRLVVVARFFSFPFRLSPCTRAIRRACSLRRLALPAWSSPMA